jgi:hypothetical protein
LRPKTEKLSLPAGRQVYIFLNFARPRFFFKKEKKIFCFVGSALAERRKAGLAFQFSFFRTLGFRANFIGAPPPILIL